jgi:hypothetical protein
VAGGDEGVARKMITRISSSAPTADRTRLQSAPTLLSGRKATSIILERSLNFDDDDHLNAGFVTPQSDRVGRLCHPPQRRPFLYPTRWAMKKLGFL